MAKYILLGNWTDQGAKDVKSTAQRSRAAWSRADRNTSIRSVDARFRVTCSSRVRRTFRLSNACFWLYSTLTPRYCRARSSRDRLIPFGSSSPSAFTRSVRFTNRFRSNR